MSLALGIDVGTTFTAAAIWRDERVEVAALETHRVTVPTVVFADGDDVQYGAAAATRGASQPSGMAREFKRRLGDPVPIMLSGAPYAADRLVAMFARWVLDSVAEQLGEVPDRVVVTHPANWTEFQLHLLTNALEQVGLGDVGMLTEPQAAAIDFGAAAHLDTGDLVVVYDLGGGTFDVSLLRREPVGFTHVGEPAGVERLGGIDFDEAVFQHVLTNVPEGVVAQARSDQAGRMALAQLRRSCVEAKESLSSEVAVDVPVVLPGVTSTVRLTRAEFEEMIRPMLDQTVDLVQRVVSQAGISAADLAAVLLVGGSSRIPVVSELVRERLGAPVRVDAHPKLVVARGAARWAGTIAASPPRPARAVAASPRRRRGVLVAAGLLALVAAGGVAWYATAGGGDDEPSTTGTTGESPASEPPESSVATGPSTDAPETSTRPTSSAVGTVPTLPAGQTVVAIEPIGMDEIPNGPAVDGQPLAAPTALSADPETGQLLAVSDTDNSEVEAALFSVAVDLSDGTLGEGDVTVESATTLLDAEGQPYGLELDVEAITATDDGRILIASEGSASGREPFIHEIDRDGRFVDAWTVPDWYLPDPDVPAGIRPEGGLNSLTTAGADSAQVLAGVEYTLYQDETSPEPEGDKWVRILAYDTASGDAVAEYAYPLDATTPNPEGITSGLLDLTALGDGGTLIALERSRREEPSQIRLYEVTLDPAAAAPPSPEGPATLLAKRELTALDPQLPGNWQSIALGPPLPDGRTSLLVLADTNNNPGQPTTVLAFALETQAPG